MLIAAGLIQYVPFLLIIAGVHYRWDSFNAGMVAAGLGLLWLQVGSDIVIRWLAGNRYEDLREYL